MMKDPRGVPLRSRYPGFVLERMRQIMYLNRIIVQVSSPKFRWRSVRETIVTLSRTYSG